MSHFILFTSRKHYLRTLKLGLLGLGLYFTLFANAAAPKGMLETVHHHKFLSSSITSNGDQNPYAVVIVPQNMGVLQQGDVLFDNFNNIRDLQGTGSSILRYHPATGQTSLFTQVPQHLAGCPGGIGLTASMAILKSGWVIVGSSPSTDGTTATKGDGCLLVFNAYGKYMTSWSGPNINFPWGNMAWREQGDQATLFVSMAGFGVPSPDIIDPATQLPVVKHLGTVLRLQLNLPPNSAPQIINQTVIASGFAQRADRDNYIFGPTGLALGSDDTLYVTDGLDNTINAVTQASTRTDSAGTGRILTQGVLLAWPLDMVMTNSQHLIVTNGKNGQVVEIDAQTGTQIYAHWLDTNQAQSPVGNGDLFGLALTLDGAGIYYIEDDANALYVATP